MLTRLERVYSVGMSDFTREEVIQVVLSGQKCIDANLSGAWYNGETIWPEGFDPKAAGARVLED